MSADNGIYILKTKKGKKWEYRVAQLQAVENVFGSRRGKSPSSKVNISNARDMWKDSVIFTSQRKAFEKAFKISKDNYTEYGISDITINEEF